MPQKLTLRCCCCDHIIFTKYKKLPEKTKPKETKPAAAAWCETAAAELCGMMQQTAALLRRATLLCSAERCSRPESMVPLRPWFHRDVQDNGIRCGAADFVTRHSMPLLLCSADFVAAPRHSMPLLLGAAARTSLLHHGILCRCSGLRTTAFYAAAADFVTRYSMPLDFVSYQL